MSEKNSLINKKQKTPGSDYQLELQDYLIILRIHAKKIIFFTFIGLVCSMYTNYNTLPSFRASSTILIKDDSASNMVMDFSGNRNENRIQNKIILIKSRGLAKEVVEYLWNSSRRNNLYIFGTRIYKPRGQRIRRFLKELITLGAHDPSKKIAKQYNEAYSDKVGEKFADNILNGLSVSNNRSTNIINIQFTSINADEASRIANIISKTYIRRNSELSKKDAVQFMNFLDSLVTIKNIEIDKQDQIIRDFKLENNMYSLDGDGMGLFTQINNYESETYTLKTELNIRHKKKRQLELKLTDQEKTLSSQLRSNINTKLMSLRLDIGLLEKQIKQNISTYGKNHIVVKELKFKAENLNKELDEKVSVLIKEGIAVEDPLVKRQELISEILRLDSEIVGLEIRSTEIEKMLFFFNQKLLHIPKKQMELVGMDRDSKILNENYSFLRARYEEAKLTVAIQTGDAQVLDIARKPKKGLGNNAKRTLLLGVFLGLSFGVFLAFLIEMLDKTLKTIDEIEKYGLSVLGIIPDINPDNKMNFKTRFFGFQKINNSNLERKLITREDPKSPVSESYRSLRTSMLYSTQKKVKSILVSSAGPGEGKTTTVSNLAITYANLGKKTLLVDTDLRRPVIHKVFNLKKEPGVTNFLSSQTNDYESIVKKTEIENLYVITSGVIPPNPSEMLGSNRMIEFVRLLEVNFDMILFDSPPLVAVTDANMISREIDQIILVVKVGQTDKKAFHHTISNLKNIKAPIGGVIMNAVKNKSSYGSYYYYYYHQYYNYYGSDDNET